MHTATATMTGMISFALFMMWYTRGAAAQRVNSCFERIVPKERNLRL
jgi:hypothetical protein